MSWETNREIEVERDNVYSVSPVNIGMVSIIIFVFQNKNLRLREKLFIQDHSVSHRADILTNLLIFLN